MLTLKQKLGANIKYLRKKKGLSQEKLAEIINMEIPNLSNIERAKRFMTAETLEKFAKALNVTERELFDFSKHEPDKYLKADIEKLLENLDTLDLQFIKDILKSYQSLKDKFLT